MLRCLYVRSVKLSLPLKVFGQHWSRIGNKALFITPPFSYWANGGVPILYILFFQDTSSFWDLNDASGVGVLNRRIGLFSPFIHSPLILQVSVYPVLPPCPILFFYFFKHAFTLANRFQVNVGPTLTDTGPVIGLDFRVFVGPGGTTVVQPKKKKKIYIYIGFSPHCLFVTW